MYFRFIAILREIWILPINSTIWRFNDIKLRHGVNQVMPRCWKWWVNYSVWFWCLYHERFWSHKEGLRSPLPPSPPHPGCIKQKKKKTVLVWIGLRCDDHRLRRRIKMLLHIISTTWLFVTKDLSQGRGAVLNTTKDCFCKSTFVSTLICAQL